eukprot:scaffold2295_cov354-Prasinococcus_capsulatus_cf.AAC.3
MAKKKDVRIVITLECTEQRGEAAGEAPGVSRYTTSKVGPCQVAACLAKGNSQALCGPQTNASRTCLRKVWRKAGSYDVSQSNRAQMFLPLVVCTCYRTAGTHQTV